MARRKNWSAEQIVTTLRQIEVQIAQGKSIALACKEAEISEQSYYRWRKAYGVTTTIASGRTRPWATDRRRPHPCNSSQASYPHQPPCSSLTEPGPKSRSRQRDMAWP